MTDATSTPSDYWQKLIAECLEEGYRVAEQAELFVHTQMIPQLFEREGLDDRNAFFNQIDWDKMRQDSPLLWKTLAPQAIQTEEALLARGQRVQQNAQLQAMVNPPDATQVMAHLFGDQMVTSPLDDAPGGAAALEQLDKTESAQDDAFKYQVQPRTIFGLKTPSQRGFQETAGQGLEDTLPMGQGG